MPDIERFIGKYASMLISAYNPDRYVKLVELKWRDYARFFFITLGISLILFLLVFIPVAMKWMGGIPDIMTEVKHLEVSASVQTEHPVVLVDEPSVVLDMNFTGETSESDVLISRTGFIYPKYVLFGNAYVSWDDLKNLEEVGDERKSLVTGLLIFILPSIMFWFAVTSIFKLVFVMMFLVLIGYYVPRFFRHRIAFKEVVKTALLAMPSVMLIGVGLSPLAFGLFWWGFLLTTIFFVIGVAMLSERVTKKRVRAKYK